jgi:anaerobic selenocysteine-containing dehydrogenase
MALNAFAVHNIAKYVEAVVPRAEGERHDWEILGELSARLFAPAPLRKAAIAGARRITPERILDLALRIGPHATSLARLRESPHGVDLGPLEPGRLAARIATNDRCIDLAPPELVQEAERELAPTADETSPELLLIGRRQLRSNNSWLHNAHRLVKGRSRCTLLVHPDDARARGLTSGSFAKLASDAGVVVVPVEVTDEVLRGVVSLPHGWGHDRTGTRMQVAREHAGASANDVTSDAWLDTLSGTAGFNGLPVRLERA